MVAVPFDPTPNVAPSAASLGRQDLNVSPNSFGAGLADGLKSIGDTMVHGGEEFAQHAVVFQNIDNKVSSDNAYSQLMNGGNLIVSGDGTDKNPGFRGLGGKSAIDAYPQAVDNLNNLRTQIAGTLPNKATQALFEADSRRLTANMASIMAAHVSEQRTKYNNETFDGLQQTYIANAVLNPTAPGTIDNAISGLQQTIAAQGALPSNGWSPQTIAAKTAVAVSKLKYSVSEKLAVGDPQAGYTYFLDNMKDMQPSEIMQGSMHFNSIMKPVYSRNLADQALSGGLFVKPEDLARGIKSAEGGKPVATPTGLSGVDANAYGVNQILPSAAAQSAKELGIKFDPNNKADLNKLQFDDNFNDMLSQHIQQRLSNKYGGNAVLTAAAYTGGEGNVSNWVNKYGHPTTVGNQTWLNNIAGDNPRTAKYVKNVMDEATAHKGFDALAENPYENLPAMEEAIRASTKDPLVAQGAIAMVKQDMAATHAAVAAQRTDAYHAMTDAAWGGPNQQGQKPKTWAEFTSMNPGWQQAWPMLTPAQHHSIQNIISSNANGKNSPPTPESDSLRSILIGELHTDPQKFLAEDLNNIGPRNVNGKLVGGDILPRTDRSYLMNEQAKLQSQPKDNASLSQASRVMSSMGVGATVDKTNVDDHNLFVGRLLTEMDTQSQVRGRKLNDEEVMKLIPPLLMTSKSHFFGADEKEYQSSYANKIEQVPVEDRAAIYSQFSKLRGKPPTAGEIVYYYGKKHGW